MTQTTSLQKTYDTSVDHCGQATYLGLDRLAASDWTRLWPAFLCVQSLGLGHPVDGPVLVCESLPPDPPTKWTSPTINPCLPDTHTKWTSPTIKPCLPDTHTKWTSPTIDPCLSDTPTKWTSPTINLCLPDISTKWTSPFLIIHFQMKGFPKI